MICTVATCVVAVALARDVAAKPLWPVTNLDYRVSYPDAVRALPPLRGVMLPGGPCTEDDFKTLHAWGATLARYQMTRFWGKDNTNLDLADYDRWLDGKLDHLERVVLPLAEKYGLRIVVDLHVAPGGRNDREMNMFHDRKYADHFISCWQRIARRFRGRPQIFGYDLINEPEQHLPALPGCDYWTLQRRAAEAVRAIDPETTIIVESNGWDCADAFRYLSPLAMDNVIYQVHVYNPGDFTHQGVRNPEKWIRASYPDAKRGWDKDYLRRVLEPVRAFQRRHGARIYVGEFSATAWADGADRYLADCIALFNEYGFDWTYHAFREWKGWSVECECEAPGRPYRPSADNPRLRALREGLTSPNAQRRPVVLEGKSAGWLSKEFAVEPRGRYRLTMRAKVTGPMTVEDNVEFAEAFYDASCPDRGRLFPGWSKVFTGPDGKRGDMHIFFPYWYVFISRHERAYVDEFYVPAGCDTLKVRYGLGGATRVEATEPVLEKVTGETVNVNPRFDCAPHCMAGYAMAGFGSSARMLPRPEGGGSFLRVLEWVYTDPAPVTPGTRYLVRFKLRPDTFSGANNTVTFFDADFKSIPHSGGRVLVRQALKCGEESFVAPPGAACVQILVGSADYESIEILPTEKEAK